MIKRDSSSWRVAVLGGGMGGLACAHELSRRGADVTIYEAGGFLGGKARSHYLTGTGTGGRRDLPGEHGFRFYPAFYQHVIETMNEISDPLSPTGFVSGNLVAAPEAGVALDGRRLIITPRRPRSFGDVVRAVKGVYEAGGTLGDLGRYLGAHLKFLTSCDARREGEIEAQSWAAYIGADAPGRYQESFREVLLACTRTMMAMNAERGSSRTLGKTSSLLILDSFGATDVDRTMMGPTSEVWIDPWQAQLARQGVKVVFDAPTVRLHMTGGEIARAWVRTPEGERPVEADAYVLAVPLEIATRLVSPQMAAADASLNRLAKLDVDRMTNWMVGAQYFLREDVPLCEGHVIFARSPWALTAISQAQFWNRGARGMSTYGDGALRGIMSVDVSACFTPDRDGKRLVDETSREGILRRIWGQLLDAVDPPSRRVLARAMYAAHLDDEVAVGPTGVTNTGRLLVHPPGSWRDRPTATTSIPNLFLAADYVRTAVDVASMEGANEAGRRAARGVLRRFGGDADSIKLFDFEMLHGFEPLRRVDRGLHAAGLPHLFDAPSRARAAVKLALAA
jgi:15-cis-phytoene desaturase